MKSVVPALITAALILTVPGSAAVMTYDFVLNKSALVGSPSGPFSLDFQLTDGNSPNNTVSITDINLGTGSPTGVADLTGGASGDLSTSITLADTDFLNSLVQGVVIGNLISFRFSFDPQYDNVQPDQFSFAILDSTGGEISTGDPSGALLVVDFRNPITPQVFAASDFNNLTLTVTPVGGAVPEPTTAMLLGLGIAGLAALRRRA